MFGSIGLGFLAMNPIGDKQRLEPRAIGAFDIGQKPVAHGQGAFRVACRGSRARQS